MAKSFVVTPMWITLTLLNKEVMPFNKNHLKLDLAIHFKQLVSTWMTRPHSGSPRNKKCALPFFCIIQGKRALYLGLRPLTFVVTVYQSQIARVIMKSFPSRARLNWNEPLELRPVLIRKVLQRQLHLFHLRILLLHPHPSLRQLVLLLEARCLYPMSSRWQPLWLL